MGFKSQNKQLLFEQKHNNTLKIYVELELKISIETGKAHKTLEEIA